MPGRESLLWGHPLAPEDAPRRSILHCGKMLAPFQEALPQLGFAPGDMAEGERQFYAFMKGLYVEMYADPGFFLIPEGEYDNYIRDLGGNPPVFQCGQKGDLQEMRLRGRFQQAIRFYAAYLYQLGTRAESLENGVLTLSAAAWREARRAVEWPHLRGTTEERFRRLGALGLDERAEPGGVYVTSREFPKMLYGLWALCSAPDNRYRYMDYLRLDFAAALRGGPAVEDLLRTLAPQRRYAAQSLHAAMEGQGFQPEIRPLAHITWDARWRVGYFRGGRRRAGFSAGPDSLTFYLYFSGPEEASRASALVRQRDPRLGVWLDQSFPQRLCRCPNLRKLSLGEGERSVCALACRGEFPEPGTGEVRDFLRVLELLRPLDAPAAG